MKLKATIPILAGLLLLASCSNDEPIAPQQTDEPAATLSFDRELSADDAVTIAREAVICLKYGDAVESRSATSLTPSQVRRYPAVSRSATTPGTYIVNFAEGGYAVVVADTADPQVLALNDEGTFDPYTQPGNAYFMTLADDYLAAAASLIDSISLKPLPPPIGEGGETPVNPNPGLAYVWHDGHRCGREKVNRDISRTDALMTTLWHQDLPYNKYCLCKDSDGNTVLAVAGCLPIALAQVMAYNKKPVSWGGRNYEWEKITGGFTDLPVNHVYGDDVAYLVNQIGLECRVTYGETSTSGSLSNALSALYVFGYDDAMVCDVYSASVIADEINNKRPVIIRANYSAVDGNGTYMEPADGHAWVIDGVYTHQYGEIWRNLDANNSICHQSITTNTYFHCNWGWKQTNNDNKDDNGFYLSLVFDPQYSSVSYYFTRNFKFIYNIK